MAPGQGYQRRWAARLGQPALAPTPARADPMASATRSAAPGSWAAAGPASASWCSRPRPADQPAAPLADRCVGSVACGRGVQAGTWCRRRFGLAYCSVVFLSRTINLPDYRHSRRNRHGKVGAVGLCVVCNRPATEVEVRAGGNDRFVVGWQACLRGSANRRGQKANCLRELSARREPSSTAARASAGTGTGRSRRLVRCAPISARSQARQVRTRSPGAPNPTTDDRGCPPKSNRPEKAAGIVGSSSENLPSPNS